MFFHYSLKFYGCCLIVFNVFIFCLFWFLTSLFLSVKKMVEINFLCVHKKLRSKRVAPVLIREITRRVNLEGIFQAVYTAGVVLPKPVATCRYWHRSLNPRKLVEVKFSHLSRNMTLQRTMKLYRLPDVSKNDVQFSKAVTLKRLMEKRIVCRSLKTGSYIWGHEYVAKKTA